MANETGNQAIYYPQLFVETEVIELNGLIMDFQANVNLPPEVLHLSCLSNKKRKLTENA